MAKNSAFNRFVMECMSKTCRLCRTTSVRELVIQAPTRAEWVHTPARITACHFSLSMTCGKPVISTSVLLRHFTRSFPRSHTKEFSTEDSWQLETVFV